MSFLPDGVVRRLRAVANWPEFSDDRYVVVSEIARGGMGTIYLARDEALDREVAIKISNAIAQPELEARLRTEARVLAQLEHPGIVPIHDVGRLADGRLFYVMKRVRGRTLLEHLGPIVIVSERLRIFERICEAVAFAHAQGFIHRDLKPANVMIGPFGEVLVVDWGVAKVLGGPAGDEGPRASTPLERDGRGGHTDPGVVLGTRGFMAPEQARGGADAVDARADVYGLGAVLFTLLTGNAPPDDSTAPLASLLDQQRKLPRPLRAICRHALSPDPDDRYPGVTALADDVARFRAGQAVQVYRENLWERMLRIATLYRTPILIVLAYLVMRVIVALVARR